MQSYSHNNIFNSFVLTEKYVAGSEKIIQIIDFSNSDTLQDCWYKDFIGHIFYVKEFIDIKDVEKILPGSLFLTDYTKSLMIKKSFFFQNNNRREVFLINKIDCEVLK